MPSSSSAAESFREYLLKSRRMRLRERTAFFTDYYARQRALGESPHGRIVHEAIGPHTAVAHIPSGTVHEVRMFGSNSYLGLTQHPHVIQKMHEAIDRFGAGMAGPPILAGRSVLHRELEERLADFKGKEDALLFTSGYGANVGLLPGLFSRKDIIVYDALHHASFVDGIRMSGAHGVAFPHNDAAELARILDGLADHDGEVMVGVEGVYSMDGDIAPLDAIAAVCRERDVLLNVDDAHGTGLLGPGGAGSSAHFGVTKDVDLVLTTFSKVFGVAGGAIAGGRDLVDYLRFHARSHVYSAALPPVVVAAVLAGLDVMAAEPERRERLHHNVRYLTNRLREVGFTVPQPDAGIVVVLAAPGLSVRYFATTMHERGFFINQVEFPAVPAGKERFRLSLMATHTEEDLDRLVETMVEVWNEQAPEEHRLDRTPSASAEARAAA